MTTNTTKNTRVAILCPYPFEGAPGQRFRYEQYLSFLAQKGIVCEIHPFLDQKTNSILYKKGYFLQKAAGLLKATLQRIGLMPKLKQYDYIWVYREASLIGPPWFEWFAAKILGKKILYDFDDAIWIPKTVSHNPLVAFLRRHKKTENICCWAYRISCGNDFLCSYAGQFNKNVVKIPTTIDTHQYHNRLKQHRHLAGSGASEKIIIGWTGTISTMVYLEPIYPVIARLAQQYAVEFRIISNSPPPARWSAFVRFVPWQKESEIDDLLAFDIGLMPLSEGDWERGKCGFKILQYMALGIPAVASSVGVNSEIIQDGQNGLLVANDNEELWFKAIERLIVLPGLRKRFGEEGRQTVEKYFSVQAQKDAYLALFEAIK